MGDKRFIYIAGPYTRPDPIGNVSRAIEIADELAKLGYIPFIPHLTHFWDAIFRHSWQFWIEQDKNWILKCDALLRINGESVGADMEVKFAEENGMPVYFSIEDLIAKELTTS